MTRLGRPRVHLREVGSAIDVARDLALGGAPHGTLVTADEQTAGRGRQGRTWTAQSGEALLLSVVLRSVDELLPLRAAVAVAESIPVPAQIKWPNDVWVGGKKVAGILVEGRPQEGWAVLGIGLNVATPSFPDELSEIATSLALEGIATSREDVLGTLLSSLDRLLLADAAEVLAAWRQRDALLGTAVSWNGGRGTGAGITDAGALLVETDAGVVELDAGEVHLSRD